MNEFFVSLGFNTELNGKIMEQVSGRLSEKYGGNFSIDFLGDRFNTDHAKLYAHPENRPDEMFCVYLYRDTDIMVDDYTLRINLKKVSDAIEKAFSDEGIDSAVKVSSSFFDGFNMTYEEEEPREFAKKYVTDEFFVYMAVRAESFTAEKAERALSTAKNAVGADIRAIGYTYKEDSFDNAVETVRKALDSGRTPLEDCGPAESFTAFASDTGCTFSSEKLSTDKEGI